MDVSFTFKNVDPSTLPAMMAKAQEISELVQSGGPTELSPSTGSSPAAVSADVSNEVASVLNDGQAQLLVAGCSGKTITVLRTPADGRSMPFKLSSFIREIGFDLDGVWGGLTKRTRNILKDRDARLVVWKNYYGQDGKWTDAEGTLAEGTIESLRKALNITKVG